MTQRRKTVSIPILDKDYQISCEADDEPMLAASARHLDNSMRSIRNSGKVVGSDRIAVMAALNVTNEMLHGRRLSSDDSKTSDYEVRRLIAKLDAALSDSPKGHTVDTEANITTQTATESELETFA